MNIKSSLNLDSQQLKQIEKEIKELEEEYHEVQILISVSMINTYIPLRHSDKRVYDKTNQLNEQWQEIQDKLDLLSRA